MGFNLCRVTIQRVYEDKGWKYSCTKCRKKVTLTGNYWCFECEDWKQKLDERYRLQIPITDKYRVLDVTAIGETAGELLEISLKDMNDLHKKSDIKEQEVRSEIMNCWQRVPLQAKDCGLQHSASREGSNNLL